MKGHVEFLDELYRMGNNEPMEYEYLVDETVDYTPDADYLPRSISCNPLNGTHQCVEVECRCWCHAEHPTRPWEEHVRTAATTGARIFEITAP